MDDGGPIRIGASEGSRSRYEDGGVGNTSEAGSRQNIDEAEPLLEDQLIDQYFSTELQKLQSSSFAALVH